MTNGRGVIARGFTPKQSLIKSFEDRSRLQYTECRGEVHSPLGQTHGSAPTTTDERSGDPRLRHSGTGPRVRPVDFQIIGEIIGKYTECRGGSLNQGFYRELLFDANHIY